MLVGLAGLLGSVAFPRAQSTLQLTQYRNTMQQVAADLRVMRFRALNEGRHFAMRIDPSARRLEVISMEFGSAAHECIERTRWLPAGFTVLEAPPQVTVLPSGAMEPAFILTELPEFNRLFRLSVSADGVISLREEPLT